MVKKWLTWINLLVAGLIAFFILLGLTYLFIRPSDITTSDLPPPKTALPKRAFAQTQEAYDAIGEPMLSLQYAPMSQQLPDLKRFLIYYGKNGRPDATAEKTLMHFSFTGNKVISSVSPGERLYVLYDRKLNPPQYVFSPNNAETSMWIEATAQGNEALVKVSMRGETGEIIQEPSANASLALPEKEFVRFGGTSGWEIGKNRVDATLLARQRSRWFGPDVFLQSHGGKEFNDIIGKQRIDFGEGDEIYSVFVGPNDVLIWTNDRWKVVKPGPDSLGKPLLVVKKIDERIMNLELWDPDGKGKVILNLLKSSEAPPPASLLNQFKFVGARTRTQFVFEINKERMLLSPHDWLLLTKEGWIKLVTPKEIDDFVERKLVGPLFIFDEVERHDDKQFLRGTIFNAARTDMLTVEIPLQQNAPAPGAPGKGGKNDKGRPPQRQGSPPNIIHRPLSPDEEDMIDDEDMDMMDDEDENFDEDEEF